MNSIIKYQGSGRGEHTLAYCTDSPDIVLSKLFRKYRILEYKGADNLLTPNWPGLIIRDNRGDDAATAGTTVTESVDCLNLNALIPQDVVLEAPLSDADVKQGIARHLNKRHNYPCEYTDNEKNYIIAFDIASEREKRPEWFEEEDETIKVLLEATNAMLKISTKEELRKLYKEAYQLV